jgi:hypothetical protein
MMKVGVIFERWQGLKRTGNDRLFQGQSDLVLGGFDRTVGEINQDMRLFNVEAHEITVRAVEDNLTRQSGVAAILKLVSQLFAMAAEGGVLGLRI